mgnify:FL=1
MSMIPLVGQPATVHQFGLVASLTCNCRPENTPLLILGVMVGTMCMHCKKTYLISAIQFDKSTDPGKIQGAIGYM